MRDLKETREFRKDHFRKDHLRKDPCAINQSHPAVIDQSHPAIIDQSYPATEDAPGIDPQPGYKKTDYCAVFSILQCIHSS